MTKDQFRVHGDIWEANAKSNAKWAVISDPARLHSGFNSDDFLASGRADIEAVMAKISRLGLSIDRQGTALDFGCGVGRLTQALALKFRHVTGLDVSPEMVRQANEFAAGVTNIDFRVNPSPELSSIADNSLAFILSLIVIQHIPPPFSLNYLGEFARVLAPGGILAVQVPTTRKKSWKNTARLVIPERLFRLKHRLLKAQVPYVTMFGIAESELTQLMTARGLRLVHVESDSLAGLDWESRSYVFTKDPAK